MISLKNYLGGNKQSSNSGSNLPSHIRDFKKPSDNKLNVQYLDRKDKSNLLITVNTNIGYKQMPDEKTKEVVYTRLDEFMTEFGERIKSNELLKIYGSHKQGSLSNIPVSRYEYSIEMGNKHGLMHSHAILFLDSKAHIDLKKSNDYLASYFADLHNNGQKPYLNVKNFNNTDDIISAYIHKTQKEVLDV